MILKANFSIAQLLLKYLYIRDPNHESTKTHMNRLHRRPFDIPGLPGGARGEQEPRMILCTIAELMLDEASPMALYALETFSPDPVYALTTSSPVPAVDRNTQFNELYPTMERLDVESMKKIIWENRSKQEELLCAFIFSCEIPNFPPNKRPTLQAVVNWDAVELVGVSVTARTGSSAVNPNMRQGEDRNLPKFFAVLIEDSNDLGNHTHALHEYVGRVLTRKGKNLTLKL